MSNLPARLAALVLAGAVLLLGACGPLDPTTSGNANVGGNPVPQAFLAMGCTVDVHAPEVAPGGRTITASAEVDCLKMSGTLITHVTIAKQDTASSPWDAYVTESNSTIPYANHPVTTTAKMPCVDGWYRTQVLITGHAIGRDYAYTVPQRPIGVIFCDVHQSQGPVNPV